MTSVKILTSVETDTMEWVHGTPCMAAHAAVNHSANKVIGLTTPYP